MPDLQPDRLVGRSTSVQMRHDILNFFSREVIGLVELTFKCSSTKLGKGSKEIRVVVELLV